jgi:hypothetical protein
VDKHVAAAVAAVAETTISKADAKQQMKDAVAAVEAAAAEKIAGLEATIGTHVSSLQSMVAKTDAEAMVAEAITNAQNGKEGKIYSQEEVNMLIKTAKQGTVPVDEMTSKIQDAIMSERHKFEDYMPSAEVAAMIEAATGKAADMAHASLMEKMQKESLAKEIVALQVEAGILPPEQTVAASAKLITKSLETLAEQKDMYEKVNIAVASAGKGADNKFQHAHLGGKSQGAGSKSGFTVGWPSKGKWE